MVVENAEDEEEKDDKTTTHEEKSLPILSQWRKIATQSQVQFSSQ